MDRALRDHLEFAVETAYLAGRSTLGYFQTGLRAEFKDDDSPVTIADRATEQFVRERIEARYPGHAILGEEFGPSEAPDATHRWIVDPIDGTQSFVRGVPLYGVLLALEIEGEVAVGVANFPACGDLVYAATGEGCYWNGRRTQVSPTVELANSIAAFTDFTSFARHGRARTLERVAAVCGTCRGWSDSYGHMLVATGRVEVMLELALKPWDCAPFGVILREAGGYFGDWSGNETINGRQALSTSQALLPGVLKLLEGDD